MLFLTTKWETHDLSFLSKSLGLHKQNQIQMFAYFLWQKLKSVQPSVYKEEIELSAFYR